MNYQRPSAPLTSGSPTPTSDKLSYTRARIWISHLIFNFFHPAMVLPIFSSNSTTPTTLGSRSEDSSFQVLASGAQELSALLGLFATDSVEAYTVDFGRPILAFSVAASSMLGLLGWVRAMFKMTLGPEACREAGYSTVAERPLLGVGPSELLPNEAKLTVVYLERRVYDDIHCTASRKNCTPGSEVKCQGGYSEWVRVKEVEHSSKSMEFISLPSSPHFFQCSRLETIVRIPAYLSSLSTILEGVWSFYWTYIVGIITAVTLAPSTTMLFFVSQDRTWATYMGTFGLYISLLVGTINWAEVYSLQQRPPQRLRVSAGQRGPYSGLCPDHLAFLRWPGGFGWAELTAVYGRQEKWHRTISGLSAVCAAFAYICQYAEVSKLSTLGSAIWLAVQGGLAVIRVIVWMYWRRILRWKSTQSVFFKEEPHHDDRFCAFMGRSPEEDFITPWLLRHGDFAVPDRLIFPNWLRRELFSASVDPKSLFTTWRSARIASEKALTLDDDVKSCMISTQWWDFPNQLFASWLYVHTMNPGKEGLSSIFKAADESMLTCCAIFANGKVYLWPGIMISIQLEDSVVPPDQETGRTIFCITFAGSLNRPSTFLTAAVDSRNDDFDLSPISLFDLSPTPQIWYEAQGVRRMEPDGGVQEEQANLLRLISDMEDRYNAFPNAFGDEEDHPKPDSLFESLGRRLFERHGYGLRTKYMGKCDQRIMGSGSTPMESLASSFVRKNAAEAISNEVENETETRLRCEDVQRNNNTTDEIHRALNGFQFP